MPRYGLTDPDYAQRLRNTPGEADGPFYVLTLFKYLPGGQPQSGRSTDPDDQYFYVPALTAVGASIRFVATVVAGPGDWDRVGIIGYPTRRSFVQLSESQDAWDWYARRAPKVERMTVVGMLPAEGLPVSDSSTRVLLEIWNGAEPSPLTSGPVTRFTIEGTIIGDGRAWSGARYTPIEPGTVLPLQRARLGYQALLVQPTVDRWQ